MITTKIAFLGTSYFARQIILIILYICNKYNYNLSLIVFKRKVINFSFNYNHIRTAISLSLNPFCIYSKTLISTFYINNYKIIIVIDYGLFIPNFLLKNNNSFLIGIHPSLLPILQGASPILTSILNNQIYTGLSIIKLNDEMDLGYLYYQQRIHIKKNISSLKRN